MGDIFDKNNTAYVLHPTIATLIPMLASDGGGARFGKTTVARSPTTFSILRLSLASDNEE